MWSTLFGWAVVGPIVTVLIGIGFGVLSMSPPEFQIARVCFCVAAVLLLGKTGAWLITSQSSLLERGLIALLIFGVSGAAWVESMRWVKSRELRLIAIQQPEKTPPGTKSTSPEPGNRKPTFKDIKPEHREPIFKEISGPFRVVVGSNSMILSEANTRDKPTHMIKFGDLASMDAYVEKGKVYVNAVLFGDDNREAVALKHNEFTSPPAKWDRNFDDTALEIVDGNLVPRFQLIYKDTRTVIINGVYKYPGGLVVMTDDGMTLNPTPPLRFTMKRIFKYPSRLYQGQEITPQ